MKFQSKAPNYRIQRNSLVGWCIHLHVGLIPGTVRSLNPLSPLHHWAWPETKSKQTKADKTPKCYFGGSLTKKYERKNMKGKQDLEKQSNKGGAETPRIKQ